MTKLSTTLVAVGWKAPAAAEFVVNEQFAEFSAYADGQLASIRYQPFDKAASWAWQRGWLDALHYSSIPPGCDPEDYEDRRSALYAQYNVLPVRDGA